MSDVFTTETSSDGKTLDFTCADAYAGPGGKGLRVNSSAVFVRVDGGPWQVTGQRSWFKASCMVEGRTAADALSEMGVRSNDIDPTETPR